MSLTRILEKSFAINNVVTTTNSSSIDLEGASNFSVQCNITVNTPSAKVVAAATDVNISTETFTSVAHGFTTGLKVQLTTTTTLPGGLSLATDYFVIVVTADTFKLANSLVNALAGTAIDLTTTGTGNHTITPVALAGASIKLQKSNDNVNWIDDGSPTSITVSANIIFEKDSPSFKYVRVSQVVTAGRLSVDNIIVSKGF